MATTKNPAILQKIALADTPEKVWDLVIALAGDANGYPDAVYLQNVKDWAETASAVHHGLPL